MKKHVSFIATSTGGRVREFQKLILSLNSQSNKNFEVIFVDQTGGEYDSILENINFNFKLIKSDIVPLSKARNLALKSALGNRLVFCDDDVTYDTDFVDKISKVTRPVICFKVFNEGCKVIYGNRNFPKRDVTVGKYNFFNFALSAGLSVNRELVNNVGGFDENLGAGTENGSGEETDLILRVCENNNLKLFYLNDLYCYHPKADDNNSEHGFNDKKSYLYAKGVSYTIIKNLNIKNMPLLAWLVYNLCKTFIAIYIKPKQASIYKGRFRGFIDGI